MTVLEEISQWYAAQCDGEWEHSFGISIQTMDNPGWHVRIELNETLLELEPFVSVSSGQCESSESVWIKCEKNGAMFEGMGDPSQLEAILKHFIDWAKDRDGWLGVPSKEELQARADNRLWELLGTLELPGERCTTDGCNHSRMTNSIFCRYHHWIDVIRRPLPAGWNNAPNGEQFPDNP